MKWEIDQKAPEAPKIQVEKRLKKDERLIIVKNLTLLTPMLGGGVASLKNDPSMPIRGQSIRGHLRFWWRTFQTCRTVDELRKKENILWGSTSAASKVRVDVTVTNQNWKQIIYRRNMKQGETDLPKYVVFPLDNTKNDQGRYINDFNLISGGGLTLKIACPITYEKEVTESLRLWLLFGGIGARTRRGMGALYSPTFFQWKNEKEIIEWLKKIVPNNKGDRQWPCFLGAKLIIRQEKNHNLTKTWNSWIGMYQKFRQHRRDKKTGKISPFGKSTWPEPDAIRHLHKNSKLGKNAFFPRGAYGLPVMYHFPQEKMDYSLEGVEDRWASPVILKISKLNETSIAKICLLLKSPLPPSWQILGNEKKETLPSTAEPFAEHPRKNSEPLNGDDPYTALMRHMSQGGPIINLGGE